MYRKPKLNFYYFLFFLTSYSLIMLNLLFRLFLTIDQLELHRDPESTCLKNKEFGLYFVRFDDEAFARSLVERN